MTEIPVLRYNNRPIADEGQSEVGLIWIVHSNLNVTHLTCCFFAYNIEKHVRFDNNAVDLSISTSPFSPVSSSFCI